MAALKFHFLLFCALAIASGIQYSEATACEFRDESSAFVPKAFEDNVRTGTLIYKFTFESGVPKGVIYNDVDSEEYFISFVHKDPEDLNTHLTLRTNELFSDLLDKNRPENPGNYKPNISVSCEGEDNVNIPDWFSMRLRDTNNKAPRVLDKGIQNVIMEGWNRSMPILSLYVYDMDYTLPNAKLPFSHLAQWNAGSDIPKLTAEVNQEVNYPEKGENGYYRTKIDIFSDDKLATNNQREIKLTTKDLAGNSAISYVDIQVSGGIQNSATISLLGLISLLAIWKHL